MIYLEEAARIQLAALQVGPVRTIPLEQCPSIAAVIERREYSLAFNYYAAAAMGGNRGVRP
ncbi:MAG: hypothetical protein EXR28_06045 [Betaproteobacteria bacterium]|nr:hypothetical protein [Betaproteobacteria bacterium]